MESPEIVPPHSATRTPNSARPGLLLLFIVGVLIAHHLTPTTTTYQPLHVLYQRILYIPIVLSAFWYGWRGGLLAAVVTSAGYLPHILHDWGGDFFTRNLNQTLEIVMYIVVGSLTGYLVDRLKRHEAQLSQANIQLASQARQITEAMETLTRKTREVFEAEEQLRRSDRLAALGQLAAGLAHEIRNPLASIGGVAEILTDPATLPEEREKFCQVLNEETERLDRVLANFLHYARSKRNEEEGSSDLGKTLAKVISLLDKETRSKGIAIEVRLPPQLAEIPLEESLLQQLLLNILLNSIQAMSIGGKIIVEAISSEKNKLLSIAITDTGSGLPKEVAEHAFDPFFTTKPHGTGLGLSIVHKILDDHNGSIRIDETYTTGARFIITIPCA